MRVLRPVEDGPTVGPSGTALTVADPDSATLVALAEELDAWTILTLDRRDFSVYRGTRTFPRPRFPA